VVFDTTGSWLSTGTAVNAAREWSQFACLCLSPARECDANCHA
jgi:hypothetical protein